MRLFACFSQKETKSEDASFLVLVSLFPRPILNSDNKIMQRFRLVNVKEK
jgi:hypothetical protein